MKTFNRTTVALNHPTGSMRRCLAVAALTCMPFVAVAQALHPWQSPQSHRQAEAYFTNLKDNDSVVTPFVAKFGLSEGWGIAPIASPSTGKGGHHHLLINRDLPLDFKAPLPFNEQYIHFGKGQMEHPLNLAPGSYTLRLLLADQKHLPHFVYSKPLRITVTKQTNSAVVSPAVPSVDLLNLLENAELKTPFRLQFHTSSLQVAHKAQKLKDTGFFRLILDPKSGGKTVTIDFVRGQTEVWLKPPAGDYTAQLMLVDNLDDKKPLATSAKKAFTVL